MLRLVLREPKAVSLEYLFVLQSFIVFSNRRQTFPAAPTNLSDFDIQLYETISKTFRGLNNATLRLVLPFL